ncbi:hypothetical protein GY03_18815 [Proteus vulgaris]|nr:hypothetical protein [Proteus vulgaris]MCT6519329.1 hypothetical protein [Proteus vulgaris]
MRRADLPEYFSPKSIVLSDVKTVKAVDSLSITDVMILYTRHLAY